MSYPPEVVSGFTEFRVECSSSQLHAGRRLTPLRSVWIFGAGKFGRDVCDILTSKGFYVAGFIESKPRTDKVLGFSVVTWDQLNAEQRQAQLVIGIFNRSMPLDELASSAKLAKFEDIFMPWDIYSQFGTALGWRYWLSAPDLILNNLDALERTYQSLSDVESRQCLLDICRFRLGFKPSYGSFRHDVKQYFNELTLPEPVQKPLRYVDGGAYNGDTFVDLTADYKVESAYLFEPDRENFLALCKAVKSIRTPALCLPIALAERYQILSFNAGNGEAGTIDINGNVHIAAMALDDLLSGQDVNFLKLDVEGAEVAALTGAAEVIKRCRPILAISLYHRAQDLWAIPQSLEILCINYRFYLRQHFFNSFDSVLYAIPNAIGA